MRTLLDYSLRGFGQMVLANNPVTGLFVLAGIACISPLHSLLALLAAMAVTTLARLRLGGGGDAVLKTGLFSVNGALLGSLWASFPLVPWWLQVALTAAGCALIAWLFAPTALGMHRSKSPFVLFSVPYLVVAWMSLAALTVLGLNSPELSLGWHFLKANRNAHAERLLSSSNPGSPSGMAWRAAGLGWVMFRAGNFSAAEEAFLRAQSHDGSIADISDGLGWSLFRQGRLAAAETEFRRAVSADKFLADSWAGLGWCALSRGDSSASSSAFARASFCSPLFSDAFGGLSKSSVPPTLANLSGWWSGILQEHLSLSAQLLSVRTILAWLCFFVGVMFHSRIISLVALLAVGWCFVGSFWMPSFAEAPFALNVVAIFLALGGHYLRLGWVSIGWTFLVTALLASAQGQLNELMLSVGLAPLCLPFNVALLGSLALLPSLRNPIGWACTSPEEIRVFEAQKRVADACWSLLSTAHPRRSPEK